MFYISPEFFEFERQTWLAKQWYVLGHSNELPEVGSYIVRDLLGESLIIIRDAVGGYYNVCCHRGSHIGTADGKASSFVGLYQAWSCRLGGLRTAPAMSREINLKEGLHASPVRQVGTIWNIQFGLCFPTGIFYAGLGIIRSNSRSNVSVQPL